MYESWTKPFVLYRIVSCRVVSCRVVSCRVVSCRVVSCRVVSCRACRVVSRRVASRRVEFNCIVLYCIVLNCIVLYLLTCELVWSTALCWAAYKCLRHYKLLSIPAQFHIDPVVNSVSLESKKVSKLIVGKAAEQRCMSRGQLCSSISHSFAQNKLYRGAYVRNGLPPCTVAWFEVISARRQDWL